MRNLQQGVLAVAVLASLAIAGCSRVQFAYNNVDWLVLRQAKHYLDLDDSQRERVTRFLDVRMDLHRREELPLYVASLARIRQMAADGLSIEEVEWIRLDLQRLYERTMRETVPMISPVLLNLSDEQIDGLEIKMQEKNREYQQDKIAQPMEIRFARRSERNVKLVEFWTGDLRDDQLALIERRGNAMPTSAEYWLAYREGKQRQLLALIRRQASEQELNEFLMDWWVELAGIPAALEREVAISQAGWARLVLDLDASLDKLQREHLLDKLDHFIDELRELVAETTATL